MAVLAIVICSASAANVLFGVGGGLDWVQFENYTQMLPKASVTLEFPNAAKGDKIGFGLRNELQGVFKPISARNSLADVMESPKDFVDTEAWGVDATIDIMGMVYRNFLASFWYAGAGYGLSFASHGMFTDTHPKEEDLWGFDTNYAFVATTGVMMPLNGSKTAKLRVEANYRNMLDAESGDFKDPSVSAIAALAFMM